MNAPFGLPGQGPIQRFEAREALGFLPPGHIYGLTLSNDTTDATNDIALSQGAARSTCTIVDGTPSTYWRDQVDLDIPVSIIKQLDVAFAPENYDDGVWPPQASGGRSGGRSTSSLSNTWWHGILAGGGGLKPDLFFHDSATQSSILAEMQKLGGYTSYRRIGAVRRVSAALMAFRQFGDNFIIITPTQDFGNATPGISVNTGTLVNVPTGIFVIAHLAIESDAQLVYVKPTFVTDQAPSASAAPFASSYAAGVANGNVQYVITDTSAQFTYRLSANNAFRCAALGWTDWREKDA